VDHRFFDTIDSESKAYWLGFVVADGTVSWDVKGGNYGVTFGLQRSDRDHLVTFLRDLQSDSEVHIDPRNGTVRAQIYSKYLAAALVELGVTPRKSGRERVPEVSIPLRHHFWRGVFDGDGSVTIQRKAAGLAPEYRFSLIGSQEILMAFQRWAYEAAGARQQLIGRASNQNGPTKTYVFYMNGNRQIEAVLSALFSASTRRLTRKYETYLSLVVQNKLVRPSYRRVYASTAPSGATG